MSRFAIALVLLSCFGHASWNLLAKRARTTPGYFWIVSAIIVIAGAPFFVALHGSDVLAAPRTLGLCLLVTGVFEAAYFAFLALAYRHGDVSLVYPIARTAPVFLVPLSGLLLHQWPTLPAALGILLVVTGCFLLPFPILKLRSNGTAWRGLASRASLWALATALASSGYTLIDSIGMHTIQRVATGVRGAFLYGYLEWISTTTFLSLPAFALDGIGNLRRIWQQERFRLVAVSGLMFVTYLLVLWAYAHSQNVAYVAGFRQLSIVIGVLGGMRFLNEKGGWARLAGTLVIVAGLILIAVAR